MILYFSGTGNSRHVAATIAKRTADQIISINQRLKELDYGAVHSTRPFGFVGPVYGGRFPRVMEDYIRKTTFSGSNDVYFIATCAATPWATERYVKKLCQDKAFTLLGFNAVLMPQGYIAGGGTQPEAVNQEILQAAQPKIEEISKTIQAGQPLPQEKPGQAVMSTLINPIMYATMIKAK